METRKELYLVLSSLVILASGIWMGSFYVNLYELIGWVGSTLLFVCGFPLAYEIWSAGNTKSIDSVGTITFLWLWAIGECLTVVYVLSFATLKWPLIVMGSINTFMVLLILRYRYHPREDERETE